MQRSWKAALQIAFTYIGTVVGAGFASGKEIVEFFVQYGSQGLVGILLAISLFIWGGIRVMVLSYRIQADSYQDLSTYLFGRPVGTIFNMLLLTVLFGTTSVMLAATGAVFLESFQLSPQLGIWVSMILIFLVARKGLFAIHSVNSLFVPLLIGFTLLVFLYSRPWLDDEPLIEAVKPWAWLSSPLYYVALNISLTQAVLVPIGRHSFSERPLIWGGILGGLGIGILLLLAYASMSVRMPADRPRRDAHDRSAAGPRQRDSVFLLDFGLHGNILNARRECFRPLRTDQEGNRPTPLYDCSRHPAGRIRHQLHRFWSLASSSLSHVWTTRNLVPPDAVYPANPRETDIVTHSGRALRSHQKNLSITRRGFSHAFHQKVRICMLTRIQLPVSQSLLRSCEYLDQPRILL